MRALDLTLLGLLGVAVAIVAAPTPASAQPSALPLAYGQKAGAVEDVGYRYRRYRYGYRPYYRPYGYGYRPYYGYGYGYRPYYRPYYGYGYGYGYPYYRRPGFGLWFGF